MDKTFSLTFPLVIAGHVDHGKSTLIGRLLHDAGALPEGKAESVKAAAERRGMPFEWSFVMDALQTERDQGITIDTTQVWFQSEKRRYVIIDAPGHREFLKNMLTGAAHAEAALLVVDAREGVREQTRRHGYLLHLLGIRQVAVLVNKMDAMECSESAFNAAAGEIDAYLRALGLNPAHIIPISARDGDNLVRPSARMAFYHGPTLLEALDAFESPPAPARAPLRLPVQDVYKFDERRILAGRVESGTLQVGDALLFSPSGARAKVASFEAWPPQADKRCAMADECVGITLDAPVFVERGQVISHAQSPPVLTTMFRGRIIWLGEEPLQTERRYKLKIGAQEVLAEAREIEAVIDTGTLKRERAAQVERLCVAEVIFRTRGPVAVDAFGDNPRTGRFVIVDHYDIAGGGVIDLTGFNDQRVAESAVKSQHISPFALDVTPQQRALANGHLGGILWFTGLSGAGKTTLAQRLQKKLFAKGYHVFVLDGDNVRKGLSRDLGFAPEDRMENLRRAGEVAALFAQAGFIVITSFISPTHADRAVARAAAPEYFHSVYVKAELEVCERRDVKGLYKKARAGEIRDFTGISAPYEEPPHPDLTLDTARTDVEDCVRQLLRYVERQFVDPVRSLGLSHARPELEDFMGSGI